MKHKDLFSLKGRVCVVTGAAGLIGKGICAAMAEKGATVLPYDKRELDITKEARVKKLINSLDKKYGRIDAWVNSAYPRTADWWTKLEDIPLSSWRKNIDMHLNGYLICDRAAAEYMKKQRSGSIINLASIYGITAPDFSIYKNTAMTAPAAYSVIKSGIIAFTRYMASYYGRFNVRVNCVSPGGVWNKQPQAFVKRYIEKTPLGRMARVEDVAGAVIYLASDAAGYVTGHNLVVDGGWSII